MRFDCFSWRIWRNPQPRLLVPSLSNSNSRFHSLGIAFPSDVGAYEGPFGAAQRLIGKVPTASSETKVACDTPLLEVSTATLTFTSIMPVILFLALRETSGKTSCVTFPGFALEAGAF